jgi:hypothetical protein
MRPLLVAAQLLHSHCQGAASVCRSRLCITQMWQVSDCCALHR